MAIIFPENGDIIWLLYQDITGAVRLIRYTNSGTWQSSQSLPIKDVANQSSLTTVSYRSASSGAITVRPALNPARRVIVNNLELDPSFLR